MRYITASCGLITAATREEAAALAAQYGMGEIVDRSVKAMSSSTASAHMLGQYAAVSATSSPSRPGMAARLRSCHQAWRSCNTEVQNSDPPARNVRLLNTLIKRIKRGNHAHLQ